MSGSMHRQFGQICELIQKSHLVINDNANVEIYHHKGMDQFSDTGAVFIKIVNKEYCKSYVVQLPGQHYPDHFHRIKIETFYVFFGHLIVECEGERVILKPGEMLSIQRGESHSFFTNTGVVFEELSTTYLKNDSIYSDESIQQSTYDKRKTLVSYRKFKEVAKNNV